MRILVLVLALMGIATGAMAHEGLDAARKAYRSGDFATARQAFEELRAEGDWVATYLLGLMYRRGDGVEKDWAKAAELFEQAAEHHVHRAQSALAQQYALGRGVAHDHYRAYVWYLIAAHARPERVRKLTGGSIYHHLEDHLTEDQMAKAREEAEHWVGAHH